MKLKPTREQIEDLFVALDIGLTIYNLAKDNGNPLRETKREIEILAVEGWLEVIQESPHEGLTAAEFKEYEGNIFSLVQGKKLN